MTALTAIAFYSFSEQWDVQAFVQNEQLSVSTQVLDLVRASQDFEGEVTSRYPLLGPVEQPAVQHIIGHQFQALADKIERGSSAMEHRAAAH